MSTRLLDIHPCELKFTFELKKQSSCAVQLVNISDHYVAFKVKTTSPKKYCVRPNTGIIKPRSKCDFTVTMQAQRPAPPDLHCKDKFLVQSTVVPFGTTEDDITPGMFAKDSGKHIEDSKLSVVLISPAQPPILLPINGVMMQESQYETSVQKEKLQTGVVNPLLPMLPKDVEDVKSVPVMEESRFVKDAVELSPSKSADLSPSKTAEPKTGQDVVVELRPCKVTEPREVKDEEDTRLKLGKDIEELKSELTVLQSKLSEAGFTITRLTKERNTTIQEKETLKHELAQLKSRDLCGRSVVKVGFPFLFVCMVALIGLTLGYLLRC